MKLIITLVLAILIHNIARADTNLQTLPGNIAIHIAEMHYEHPVRLMHPYLDYWHMKGPATEKAALDTLEKHFSHVQKCDDTTNADVLLFIEPHMFYNPQSRLFYVKLIVKIYNDTDSQSSKQPFLKITKEASQTGDLGVSPEFYIEKAYTKAMQLVTNELETNQTFINSMRVIQNKHVEKICPALDALPVSKLYY